MMLILGIPIFCPFPMEYDFEIIDQFFQIAWVATGIQPIHLKISPQNQIFRKMMKVDAKLNLL